MNRPIFFLSFSFALVLAGCGPGTKEVTPLQRKEAALLASEAQFSISLRDFAAAEPLLEKAARLAHDDGTYWINLGIVRRRLKNLSGAKQAYENAVEALKIAGKKTPANSELVLQQAYVLALLGKPDDARALLEKAAKKAPDDRAIRGFIEGKQLDRILADPGFKEIAL